MTKGFSKEEAQEQRDLDELMKKEDTTTAATRKHDAEPHAVHRDVVRPTGPVVEPVRNTTQPRGWAQGDKDLMTKDKDAVVEWKITANGFREEAKRHLIQQCDVAIKEKHMAPDQKKAILVIFDNIVGTHVSGYVTGMLGASPVIESHLEGRTSG